VLFSILPASGPASDEPASNTPTPVAATRTELKEQLERSKRSHPRLPLPPPTEQDIADARARGVRGAMSGIINNGRMRKLYLPPELLGGGFTREPDPAMTLNNTFKTMFFWIVSRANNCTYCQGHQEVKLSGDGVKEETIAALDGDWSEFTPAERAAFAFTLKLTAEPNRIADADIDRLRAHYTDLQILEIITAVGGFNAMNRWTGPLAIPQEGHREYLTPTPEKYKAMRSRVVPLPAEAPSSPPVCARPADRGPLETRAQVEAALEACRKRSPRLPLPPRPRRVRPCRPTGRARGRSPSGCASWPTSPREARPGSPRRITPRRRGGSARRSGPRSPTSPLATTARGTRSATPSDGSMSLAWMTTPSTP
jgi:hypothetical protein